MKTTRAWQERLSRALALVVLTLAATPATHAQRVLTLQDALAIAMQKSPDIQRSQLNLQRSSESLNAQKAALKSQFSLSITPVDYRNERVFNSFFSRWNTNETKSWSGTFTISQPIRWTDGTLALINRFGWQDVYSEFQNTRSKTFSNNLYLSLQQPVFTYNRTEIALRRLELDLEDAALSYAIRKLALERSVAQAFFDVYKNKMSLEIAREELSNQEQSYQIIKNKVDAGLSALEELYQAELNLSTSKSNVQNKQVVLDNSLDAFKQLIGMSLFEEIAVQADITHQPVQVDLQLALDHGLKWRMELRQARIDIETSQFDLIQASATNEFRGDVTVSYGVIGTDERFANIYEVPTKNQRLSLSLEIPLWDWGEKQSRIKSAEAVVKTRELSLEEERTNIIIAIRQVYRNLQNLEQQIEIARQNVRNAQLTYDINLERYKNGDLTSMDLQLYQNQLSQKKLALVDALINYKIELLNMKIQSLWDFEKNESVVPQELLRSRS
ncbi:MAG: TolC family protein [candidate division KSB1 bacterium]|nr:TolC family protein [candidate division KSB1 bacterium]MDZ7294079.1 TolC family protein [candidate division KSB1 bacterium]MDZ7378055.1 TolC family protein [candidate division KSB1 bacterium]MDZ7391388.1 TolC family protein [candidate division KSB1 bacterium]MDZ7412329.1 TolC family protein [candidate division KSB1 bacterium]